MRVPDATYRVQFSPGFGFKEARKILPYLAELGISDIYASPIFCARKGSAHGYDVIDPSQLNPELGTMEDFEALITELQRYGMGWLQDVVPNHMAYDGENRMLMDVLENGQSSEYFDFFDVEWDHPYESMKGKLLAPFLGHLYGESLEAGEITLQYDNDGFTVNYYELKFPLRVESYTSILTYRLDTLKEGLGEDHPDFIKLLGVLHSLKNLPTSRAEINERRNQVSFAKGILWELYTESQDIKNFINENVKTFNGERENPESFNLLNNLLSEQLIRLSFWKVATEEINYRRFFNINGLISLRMEKEEVFNYAHSLVLDFLGAGKFTGVRVDHIDGLYDPAQYLKRLRDRAGDIYIVVEKILDLEEELPNWPVQGTTGYDFLNCVNEIFCERENEKEFSKIYSKFTGLKSLYEDLVCEKKRLIIGKDMAGDVDSLANLLKRVSSRDRYGSDITLHGLKRAIVEVLAHFPVYRTYINYEVVSEADRSYIQETIKRAVKRNPGLRYELDFIQRFLLLAFQDYITEEEKKQWTHFTMRFQQLTGPLMAKGFEDTTLYVYNRLLSLNDVGGNPSKFGISPVKFHDFNKKRASLWPHSMNATSTHDTKRGEDVRTRIDVISEIPEEWESNLKKWNKINKKKKKIINGTSVPDNNDEYFLYQTLVGALPFSEDEYPAFVERIKHYIIKVVREAKVHTAWLKPDTDYEQAFVSFVEEILRPSPQNQFLENFLPFQKKIAHYGIFNSLSQALIKITSPGVPDLYQGTELWDLNLVDPDNRRPVDFKSRTKLLKLIKDEEKERDKLIKKLISNVDNGGIKLYTIYKALNLRKNNKELFQEGDYIALSVAGERKNNIITFARRKGGLWVLVVAPRLLATVVNPGEFPLGNVWRDTTLEVPDASPTVWRDVFTGESIMGESLSISGILESYPVGLLIGKC